MKFKKKPLIVEAMQFTGDTENVHKLMCWANTVHQNIYHVVKDNHHLSVETLEGTMIADVGDWIIKGIEGEFYPCKDRIFTETYDEVLV